MPSSSFPCRHSGLLFSGGSDACSRSPCHSRIKSHSDVAYGLAAPTWLLMDSHLVLCVCLVGLRVSGGWSWGGSAYPSSFLIQVRPECVQDCLESRAKMPCWLRRRPRATRACLPPGLPFQVPSLALGAKGNQIKAVKEGGGRPERETGGQIQKGQTSICIIILLATMGTQDIYLKAVMLI